MAGFTTTNDGDWTFSFGEEFKKPVLPSEPNMATSYLAGPGKWDNYSDPVTYECDSLLRQFFESKEGDPQWEQQHPKWRRFTTGMMFEILFGRKYDPKADYKYGFRLSKVMAYYSTRAVKEGSIRGKRYKKTIYTLSPKLYHKKPPYSLRLRVEWLAEQGKLPTWHNMKLPKDDLKPGQARNPRTQENMEKRSEQARKRFNELYNKNRDRKH